jgi:dihydrodipicolinate synthase/N-acetylneuraminate lyase
MNIPSLLQNIQPKSKIEGISAVLLPFHPDGQIDLEGFAAHLECTWAAGLMPAVNMDTGYVNLISRPERAQILEISRSLAEGRPFVAGAFIEDVASPTGSKADLVRLYRRETDAVQAHGGTPILFQCTALKALPDDEVIAVYRQTAESCGRLLVFELGTMFAGFGRIYSLEVVQQLMEIPQITGIKHSSLDRQLEWQRLALRDRIRPDFKIYTGNDLGIDMVMYGSDYLLGLSTFAPDLFARRDAYWMDGDPRFYPLNDTLQYLGHFAFRSPTSAYKHSAAQFLRLRGWIAADAPHPAGLRRPESDVPVLEEILERLESLKP